MTASTKRTSKTLAAQLIDAGVPQATPEQLAQVTLTLAPIAQALIDQGSALAQSAETSTLSTLTAKGHGDSLTDQCRTMLALEDSEAQHVLEHALLALRETAITAVACPLDQATPVQLATMAAHWYASANTLATTVRRTNKGPAGKVQVPTFGLCYFSLDKQAATAVVRVIKEPTENDLRVALKDDLKALNAALQAQEVARKAAAPKVESESSDDTVDRMVIGVGCASMSALSAMVALAAGWRASELEAGAAHFLMLAAQQRAANATPECKAELEQAAIEAAATAYRLTHAVQEETDTAKLVAQQAVLQAEADALALRKANAAKARAEAEAEAQALEQEEAALAVRMAGSPPEPALVFTPTEAAA